MLRTLLPFVSLTLLVLAPASAGRAASFDCAKAEAPDEIAVCSNPALSEMDTEMGALWFSYRNIPFLMGGNAARVENAAAFLKERSACGGDEACLRKAYEERIAVLKRGIEDWLKSDASTAGTTQWSADNVPGPVWSIVAGYRKMCGDIDGKLEPGFETPLIMTADIDGDGTQDFVLNPQNMQCSAAATAFCGNGGCYISLALSSKGYANPETVLGPDAIMGGAPSLSQNEELGTFLDVWVDKSNCKTTDAESSCLGRYTWKDGKLSTSYMARKFED